MTAVLVIVLVVAWSLWDGTSRSLEHRRRLGLLGTLNPKVPDPRYHGRPPVTDRRVRAAVVSAILWTGAVVAAATVWGGAPITFFLGIVAVLYDGDLVAVVRRRRLERLDHGR